MSINNIKRNYSHPMLIMFSIACWVASVYTTFSMMKDGGELLVPAVPIISLWPLFLLGVLIWSLPKWWKLLILPITLIPIVYSIKCNDYCYYSFIWGFSHSAFFFSLSVILMVSFFIGKSQFRGIWFYVGFSLLWIFLLFQILLSYIVVGFRYAPIW